MLKPLPNDFKGLITITGPTKSGKSQLAEFLIKDHESVTYIATSKPRLNDPDWQRRIAIHKARRPDNWKLIQYPLDICNEIESIDRKDSILLDSLGGLVEQRLMDSEENWESFQNLFVKILKSNDLAIIVVSEEIGWSIVPSTPIGHLFRERLSKLTFLLSRSSTKKWLAVNGIAIDLDKVGYCIP